MKLARMLCILILLCSNLFYSSDAPIHYRRAPLSSRMTLRKKCKLTCAAKKEVWARTWKWGALGTRLCGCKERSAKKHWFQSKRDPSIRYHHIGVGKGVADASRHCPLVCTNNLEKFTGQVRHHWYSGTECECKIDEVALENKLRELHR